MLGCMWLLLVAALSSLGGGACAQCAWEFGRSTMDLKCSVRAIEPEVPLDLQMAETASRLQLQCSGDVLHASELPARAFARLQKLAELSVDACKLQRLPAHAFQGLLSLKRLAVHTRNAEWGPGRTLELLPNSFQGLGELTALQLGDNNIRQVPEGVWCALPGLQTLNLTANRIRSAASLGLSEQLCSPNGPSGGAELQVLDVSHNELRELPDVWGVSRLRRLQQLSVQHNNISALAANALAGLDALRVLNLSFNHLETLPGEAFAGNRELRELHLQNNELYDLPRGLLRHLEQLLVLDLSGNQLTSNHVDNATFAGLIRLVVLNVANNALTRIGARTFKDLYFLQILDLRNNSIGHVEDGAFLSLYNLHTLNLAENRLHTLDNRLFDGLFVLSKLTLNNNLITIVEARAFRNCSDLKELDLSSNQLAAVPAAVQDLAVLRTLDLGENQITEIGNGSFRQLGQLTGLRLIDNRIGNISVGMFADLPRLTVLNLARNRIQAIERGSFARNTDIEAIRLDKNFLTDINGIFATLASLLWLNLSENHLVWFDYAFVPSNLKWLDIHGNYIEALGNYYKLQEEIRVTTLDASHNRITELGAMAVPNSIELLFVNNNIIGQIQANTFADKGRLARVDLYANVLAKLALNALRVPPVAADRPLPEFYLGGNPFECDCSMEWLQRVNNLTARQHPRVVDLGNVECLVPHSRHAPIRPLATLGSADFLCQYTTHCPAACHCCDLERCDCELTCPANCTCFHDAAWGTNVVDCGKQHRSQPPQRVPADATALYLDGSDLRTIEANAFAGLRSLRSLYLNGSNVVALASGAFAALGSLRILHLENNRLQALDGAAFEALGQLRELYVHNNQLGRVDANAFAPLHSLEVLRLDNNRLTTLPVGQLAELQRRNGLQGLTLGRNAWACRCQLLQPLAQFVADNALVVRDAQDFYCVDGAGVRHDLDLAASSASSGLACGDLLQSASANAAAAADAAAGGYVPLLAAILVLIFLIVVLIVVFVFRDSVRLWLFAHYGVRVCEPRFEEAGKLYDAIILHAAKDYEFVCRTIAAELEHGRPPFRLCVQQRDLPPDASHLQIVEAARASRKVILVLTRHLVAGEWQRVDFRNAFHEALRGHAQKLVIVEEASVSGDAEDVAELAPYLKTMPANRLLTCDAYFWEKLRYAIPIELSARGNNYTLDHHERFKQPVSSPGMIFRQAPPPPAYYQEDMEANYSSATTATPSPRPSRHNGRLCDATAPMRPPSEHIYHSIESEYSAYDHHHHHHHHHQHESLSMISADTAAASYHNPHQQLLLARSDGGRSQPLPGSAACVVHQSAGAAATQQWLPSACVGAMPHGSQQPKLPWHLRTGPASPPAESPSSQSQASTSAAAVSALASASASLDSPGVQEAVPMTVSAAAIRETRSTAMASGTAANNQGSAAATFLV